MNTNDFFYNLPNDLIAQVPLLNRDESKLLVMDKTTGDISDDSFKNIEKFFKKDDILVLNDTKVMPARIIGVKEGTGAVIEFLILKNLEKDSYECLAKPQKRLKENTVVVFSDKLSCRVLKKLNDGIVHVEFIYDGIFFEILDELGTMPLPPYIHEVLSNKDRYQTVYAKNVGSAAAPTAGLHFTSEIFEKLNNIGVSVLYVTLHVGLGTFRPVEVSNVDDHVMHSEFYNMSLETSKKLNDAFKKNKKIYAVGTTSVRVLESVMQKYGKFCECSGFTDIFIYPGYKFLAVDGLITNFHLPKSTLLMLVSALSSREYIMNAYKHAVDSEYRFFSFGDAMLIK